MTTPDTDDTTALARLLKEVARTMIALTELTLAASPDVERVIDAWAKHAQAQRDYIAALEAALADANRQREAAEVALKQLENGNV